MIPDRGDFVWINLRPQSGHEQAGRRPAIVVSEADFNRVTGFALVCPITSSAKEYAFEVPIPDGLACQGVVLSDQIKSLDYQARKMQIIGHAPIDSAFMKSVMRNVRSILA